MFGMESGRFLSADERLAGVGCPHRVSQVWSLLSHMQAPTLGAKRKGDAWSEGASEKARHVGACVRRSELAPGQDSEGTDTQVRSAERATCV